MSGEWVKNASLMCPVQSEETEVEVKFADGKPKIGPMAQGYRWNILGSCYDIVEYRVLKAAGEDVKEEPAPVVSDGGSSDYYKLTIKNKAGEEFSCEMGDIIRHVFGNDFNLGNVVKAARRMYLASEGKGKEGTSIEYDANKIGYFTQEFVHWNKDE